MDIHQVTLELFHHLANLLKVALVKSRLSLVRRTLLVSVICQGNSSLEGCIKLEPLHQSQLALLTIPNLSSVPFHFADGPILKYIVLGSPCDFEILTIIIELVKELHPDLPLAFSAELLIMYDDVDSGDESIIKLAYSVGS
jgi:hypothetical protein